MKTASGTDLWLMRSVRRVRMPRSLGVIMLGGVLVWSAPGSRGHAGHEVSSVPETTGAQFEQPPPGREFYFTRAVYSDFGGRRMGAWSTDFPKADRQFLIGLKHLTNIDAYEAENPVRLDDPKLKRYPFLYALEVGYMSLTDAEVRGLREYLLAGGFLVVDDFWGSLEWSNFETQIERVFPEYPIVDIGLDHPLLSTFYVVRDLLQVPNVWLGRSGGRTWERDGYTPAMRGIFDERGRLMVVINWNTDLGDAWEWAEDPWYPIKFSNFAYQMGVNMILYGMSH